MEEVEGSIYDGDLVVAFDVPLLLDFADVPAGSLDGSGWHVHAALPLDVVVEPGAMMRIQATDGRSGLAAELGPPTIEGDRVLHIFTGTGAFGALGL